MPSYYASRFTHDEVRVRIGIDANSILGDRGGVGWHTYQLLRALLELKEEVEFVGYVKPGSLRDGAPEGWGKLARLRWVEAGRLAMPWRGRIDRLDLYHGTNFKMRTSGRYGGVVTVHDLWLDRYPQYSTKFLGQRASFRRTKRTAWRARKVITVSEYSACDIESLYGLPRNRIVVIPNGVSDDFRPMGDEESLTGLRRRFALPTDRFILFVGGADPRKNHATFLKACEKRLERLAGYSLVLVGDVHHRFGDMKETARALGLERQVVCTGRLPIVDIRLLYSHADLFVFPSIYEGFGMPVLEAMACGAPVITSNRTSLPEVAGDAAVLVNPEDAEELAEAIVRVLDTPSLRASLKEKGFERAKQFTWEQAARRTLALYRELCGVGS
ncbi:MAG: glycosyltransferase family 1 protein [Nitrospirae bacterium]|nr:MAG: glycosyltransferase family 1 protein [Nitrospirota bacterium]